MSRRRRRFSHQGVYFADTEGLRAALIDAGQLPLCLKHLLRERGLLDARLAVARRGAPDPPRTVSAREALEALASAAAVFADCAAVTERVWQATEQCGEMIDAGETADSEAAVTKWLFMYELCSRVADDRAPVRREALTAARTVLRRAERSKKARESGGDGKGEGS